MPNIFGNNNVSPPGVPIPPGPMGPQGPQGPPGPAAIQEEGVSLPARGFLNFVGSGVTAADDAAHNRVTVTVTGGGGGATPGGPDTSIQVHNAGVLTGYSSLTYDGTTLKSTAHNALDSGAWNFSCTTDNQNAAFTYSDSNGLSIQQKVTGGYYSFDMAANQAKSTTIGLNVDLQLQGASQAFALNLGVTKDSMGDCGAFGGVVTYRGGPLIGDEGQCFQCVTYLHQDKQIITRVIDSVRRAACPANMTVTQDVFGSKDPQTVNVSGTTGLLPNDWLVAGQSLNISYQHIRAVQVISVTSTTVTAVFAVTMASGDSLKPALVITLQYGNGKFGQLIPIVNLSGSVYSTGTVTSISGRGFTGSGTGWSLGMAGGDGLNIGAISLVNDNVTAEPFSSDLPESIGPFNTKGMLRSWYQILTLTDASNLEINSFSVVGDMAYRGNGPGSGQYLIRPAARALWFPDTATVVCEYSTHAWNVGDTVESTICPYPDVSLQQWNMAAYTPGGTYRGGIFVGNGGHRTFGVGLAAISNVGGHDAPWGWEIGASLERCKVGVQVLYPRDLAMNVIIDDPIHHGNINWGGAVSGGTIGPDGNVWDPGRLSLGMGAGGSSHLDFCSNAITGGLPELRWGGNFSVFGPGGQTAYFQIAASEGPAGKVEEQAGRTVGAYQLRAYRIESNLGSAGNLYFRYIDDASGTNAAIFAITNGNTGPGPWLGTMLAKRGTATASVNYGSYEAIFESSIWHAGAAQQQYAMMRIEPESMSVDAHNRFCIYIWDTLDGNYYQPNRPFAINDVGKLSIGNPNPVGSGGGFTATFDPTGITANRTITLPDASGTMALRTGAGPGELTRSVPTALNATVDIGAFNAVYAFHLEFYIYQSGGAFVTKTYDVSAGYGEDSGGWCLVRPTSEKSYTGLSVDNFELEVYRTYDGFQMRIRHTVATDTSSGSVNITAQGYGNPLYYTFTPSTAAGTSSATTYFASGAVAAVEKTGTFTAGPNFAGQLNYIAGGSGVKDIVQVCARDAAGTWAWRTIY